MCTSYVEYYNKYLAKIKKSIHNKFRIVTSDQRMIKKGYGWTRALDTISKILSY